MTKPFDGGPAFPTGQYVGAYKTKPGMTLRQYYVGQALLGLIAERAHPAVTGPGSWVQVDQIAKKAVEFADAAIKAERAGREETT